MSATSHPAPWDPSLSSKIDVLTPEMIRSAYMSPARHGVQVNSLYTLKFGPANFVTSYEYRVLKLLKRIGNLPCPRPLDFFSVRVMNARRALSTLSKQSVRDLEAEKDEDMLEEWNVMVMTTLPGQTFGLAALRMTSTEISNLLVDVKDCLEKVNQALFHVGFEAEGGGESTVTSKVPTAISDLDGRRTFILPIMEKFVDGTVESSEFVEKMEANTPQVPDLVELQRSVLQSLCPSPRLSSPFHTDPRPGAIRFCHMDLHPGNILVHERRLSGIVDWEHCGWYTTSLDAYSTLKKLYSSKDMMASYTTAWGVGDEVEQALHHLATLREGNHKRIVQTAAARRREIVGPSGFMVKPNGRRIRWFRPQKVEVAPGEEAAAQDDMPISDGS